MNELGPTIIGISGIAGSGKSTLAKALVNKLEATLIAWDDYDGISVSPSDYVVWYESGQPEGLMAWKYPKLAETLAKLKGRKSFLCPATDKNLVANKWIVFDAPLGREHSETGAYIDFWVHIDTPLDIAICRRLLRDFEHASGKEILEDIKFYLERTRPMFMMPPKLSPDLIVDGTKTTREQIHDILSMIRDR